MNTYLPEHLVERRKGRDHCGPWEFATQHCSESDGKMCGWDLFSSCSSCIVLLPPNATSTSDLARGIEGGHRDDAPTGSTTTTSTVCCCGQAAEVRIECSCCGGVTF